MQQPVAQAPSGNLTQKLVLGGAMFGGTLLAINLGAWKWKLFQSNIYIFREVMVLWVVANLWQFSTGRPEETLCPPSSEPT